MFNRINSLIYNCITHCNQVSRRDIVLDIVGWGHDVTTAWSKNLNVTQDLRSHFFRGAEWEGVLNINSTVKYQLLAKIALQTFWLHTHSTRLDWI